MQHSTAQPTEDLLDSQLATYAERAARRRVRPSTAEVLGCTAAAGGLAFAGGDALGAIVHNSTGTTFSVESDTAYFTWDVDGAGGTLSLWLSAGSATATANVAVAAGPLATTASYGLVNALPKGFVVGPSPASGTFATSWPYLLASFDTGFVDFKSTTAYFGFQFSGAAGTPDPQYGWAKARVDLFNSGAGTRFRVYEWAYDDSGAAIKVGDTGTAVPAPATPLLTLLGLGALGVAAYRRRREEGLKRLADEQDQATA
ncbi:hypothetical protein CKO31_12675 [Thiohalocapsa halophila]|uniref:Ice-binding protein C-terminal domain-containing protein n=1 Tax=Thiohalocapsa halophila TaxID=69359 RepID=A0ABS1CI36_9GAMM|nr:PEP-CTERM sorting domain-containing protein [Thiohalocapsa halophila]MBK1631582.1 hypothetical protein [Thiohalocapsa halophila]